MIYRGFELSSFENDAPITEARAAALLSNLRRCAHHWLSYLDRLWTSPDDIELDWTEQVGAVNPDPGLIAVRVVGYASTDGNLAEHDTDDFGRPRCTIFWPTIRSEGHSIDGPDGLMSAISHELCETLADPVCVRTVVTTFGHLNPGGKDEPLEVCDRIQGSDYCEPTSPGIFVANATTPAFWLGTGDRSVPGPYDIRTDAGSSPVGFPFQQLPGGYHEELGPNGESHLVFGDSVSEAARSRITRRGPRGGKRWRR